MKQAVLPHEQKFFINGTPVSGVQSLVGSYTIQEKPINVLGWGLIGEDYYRETGCENEEIPEPKDTPQSLALLNSPLEGDFSINSILSSEDFFLQFIGEKPFTGSLHYGANYFGFHSGYISNHSVSCSVGELPSTNTQIRVFGNIGGAPDFLHLEPNPFAVLDEHGYACILEDSYNESIYNASGQDEFPDVKIADQGSITVKCHGSETDRVVGFNHSINVDIQPVYVVGDAYPAQVDVIWPITTETSIELEIDEYKYQSLRKYMATPTVEDISIQINDCFDDPIQHYSIKKARLIGETMNTSVDGKLSVNLQYKSYYNKRGKLPHEDDFKYTNFQESMWSPALLNPTLWYNTMYKDYLERDGYSVVKWQNKGSIYAPLEQYNDEVKSRYTNYVFDKKPAINFFRSNAMYTNNISIEKDIPYYLFIVGEFNDQNQDAVIIDTLDTFIDKPFERIVLQRLQGNNIKFSTQKKSESGELVETSSIKTKAGNIIDGVMALDYVSQEPGSHTIRKEKFLITVYVNGNDSFLDINGTDTKVFGTLDEVAMNGFTIGSRLSELQPSLEGFISEVILVEKTMSCDNLNRVQGYMAHRWGIENLLPDYHPFKERMPLMWQPGDTLTECIAGRNIADRRSYVVRLSGDNGTEIATVNGVEVNNHFVGDTVKISATPDDPRYSFTNWTVESPVGLQLEDELSNITEFIMPNQDVVIKANYDTNDYKVSIDIENGIAVSYVDSQPSEYYQPGNFVEISAVVDEGYNFIGWELDSIKDITLSSYSDSNINFIMPDCDVFLKAKVEANTYSLSLSGDNGVESATVNGENVDSYKFGDTVLLKAEPNPGFELVGWTVVSPEGMSLSGENEFIMPSSDVSIQANYDAKTYLLAGDATWGSISYTLGDETGTLPARFKYLDNIEISANPNKGFEFEQWYIVHPEKLIAIHNTNTPVTTLLMSNTTVTLGVDFKAIDYSVSFDHDSIGGSPYIKKSDGEYKYDESTDYKKIIFTIITVEAGTEEGYDFSGWDVVYPETGVDDSDGNKIQSFSGSTFTFVIPFDDVVLKPKYQESFGITDDLEVQINDSTSLKMKWVQPGEFTFGGFWEYGNNEVFLRGNHWEGENAEYLSLDPDPFTDKVFEAEGYHNLYWPDHQLSLIPEGRLGETYFPPGKRQEGKYELKTYSIEGFYLGIYLVTQEEYKSVLELKYGPLEDDTDSRRERIRKNRKMVPSYHTAKENTIIDGITTTLSVIDKPNHPVEQMEIDTQSTKWSGSSVAEFLQILNEKEDLPVGWYYTLLNPKEWEYVCRAGTDTKYSTGNDIGIESANFKESAVNETTPVDQYPPNPWGFYDMHGNVWEVTSDQHVNYQHSLTRPSYDPDVEEEVDPYDLLKLFPVRLNELTEEDLPYGKYNTMGHYYEIRGGSFDSPKEDLRSFYYASHLKNLNLPNVGFRVAFKKIPFSLQVKTFFFEPNRTESRVDGIYGTNPGHREERYGPFSIFETREDFFYFEYYQHFNNDFYDGRTPKPSEDSFYEIKISEEVREMQDNLTTSWDERTHKKAFQVYGRENIEINIKSVSGYRYMGAKYEMNPWNKFREQFLPHYSLNSPQVNATLGKPEFFVDGARSVLYGSSNNDVWSQFDADSTNIKMNMPPDHVVVSLYYADEDKITDEMTSILNASEAENK